jgi:hypothetical protein
MNARLPVLVPFHEERIPEAKKRWEKSYGQYTKSTHTKIAITFDDFLELFKDVSNDHAWVAKCLGVTKECIRQIYNKFFREIFGGKSRQEIVNLTKAPRQIPRFIMVHKKEKRLLRKHNLKHIVTRARDFGCEVDLIPKITEGRQKNQIHTKELLVNGHLCLVRHLGGLRYTANSKRLYGYTTINRHMLRGVAFVIFEVFNASGRRLVFVVPTKVLLGVYFSRSAPRDVASVYLPTRKDPIYNNRVPLLPWWEYKNAWHLISENSTPR